MIFKNGIRYDGFFVDGNAQGRGRLVYPEGDFYVGEWDNGKIHGYGI